MVIGSSCYTLVHHDIQHQCDIIVMVYPHLYVNRKQYLMLACRAIYYLLWVSGVVICTHGEGYGLFLFVLV